MEQWNFTENENERKGKQKKRKHQSKDLKKKKKQWQSELDNKLLLMLTSDYQQTLKYNKNKRPSLQRARWFFCLLVFVRFCCNFFRVPFKKRLMSLTQITMILA